MESVALILDPEPEYAPAIIGHYWHNAGLRSVLAYSSRKKRLAAVVNAPVVHSHAIAGRVEFEEKAPVQESVDRIAAQLAGGYDVRVVPTYLEDFVILTTALCARFGLNWNSPEVMGPYRDKFAYKERVRRNRPDLPLNASKVVCTVDDVLASDPEAYSRFVLKPINGIGNRDILIRDWPPNREEVATYLRELDSAAVLEEFMTGKEFQVNGQVGGDGEPVVTAVWQANRGAVGSRLNISEDYWTVATSDPRFRKLADYACDVVRASGLTRSPFHMELILRDSGPGLIECGARLIGGAGWHEDARMHGPQCDLLGAAAHYWLSEEPYELGLDWAHYDSLVGVRVFGNGTEEGTVVVAQGVDELERTPGFLNWIQKPQVGQQVWPTVSTATTQWSFNLAAASHEQAQRLVAQARSQIRTQVATEGWPVKSAKIRRTKRLVRKALENYFAGRRMR